MAVQQCGAKVYYKGILVGDYFVDLLINDLLLVELKTVKALDDVHQLFESDRSATLPAA